jgi:hypothetical protein
MKKKFIDFYDAWWYLQNHAYFIDHEVLDKNKEWRFSRFNTELDIDVQKVNPLTDKIDDDENKNTHIEIWLECGPYELYEDYPGGPKRYCHGHDIKLDCGGATFEEAIVNLANLVEKNYPLDKYGKIEID